MRRAALLLLLALFPVAQCRLSFPARPRVAEPAPTRTRERERGVIRLGKPREQLGRLRQLLAGLLADRRKRRVLVAVVVFNWLQTQARLHFGKRRALRAFSKLERPEVTIVTTAALPWMTGTAVNALLRAAYLAESGYRVTLCVPWIHPEEQLLVMPKGKLCADPDAQEQLMRTWLSERDGAVAPFDIRFYPARFDVMRGSILPIGDTTRWVGDSCDLCVLEEPEHLNWYHGGGQWRRCFKLVVGVVHTNYLRYASLYQPENVWVVRLINKLVCPHLRPSSRHPHRRPRDRRHHRPAPRRPRHRACRRPPPLPRSRPPAALRPHPHRAAPQRSRSPRLRRPSSWWTST